MIFKVKYFNLLYLIVPCELDFRFSTTSQIVNRYSPDTLCSGQALFLNQFVRTL